MSRWPLGWERCVDWVMLNLPSPLLTRPVRVRECSNEICVIYVFITLHITDRCWLKEDWGVRQDVLLDLSVSLWESRGAGMTTRNSLQCWHNTFKCPYYGCFGSPQQRGCPRKQVMWHTQVCLRVQVHLKNLEYHEKGQYSCHSFQKVKPKYYIDSLHTELNISSLYFLKFGWLWLTDYENPKFRVSENYNIT